MDSHLSTSTRPVSTPGCPLPSLSWWLASSSPGITTSGGAGNVSPAPGTPSSSISLLPALPTTSALLPTPNLAHTHPHTPSSEVHTSSHPAGSVAYPVARFSSPPTSCGLPGCSYKRPTTVSLDSLGLSRHLPLTYESASTVALVDHHPCHSGTGGRCCVFVMGRLRPCSSCLSRAHILLFYCYYRTTNLV